MTQRPIQKPDDSHHFPNEHKTRRNKTPNYHPPKHPILLDYLNATAAHLILGGVVIVLGGVVDLRGVVVVLLGGVVDLRGSVVVILLGGVILRSGVVVILLGGVVGGVVL